MEMVSDIVFDFVYEMAVSDAMIRSSGKNNLYKNEDIKNVVKEYAKKIIDGDCDKDAERSMYEDIVKEIIRINDKAGKGKIDKFYFGRAQKLVNMTMKYLYIRYQDQDKANYFRHCYVPMDRTMIKKVYKKLKGSRELGISPEVAGSKLGKDNKKKYSKEYFWKYQEAVDIIVEEKKLNNRIEFDYQYWKKEEID